MTEPATTRAAIQKLHDACSAALALSFEGLREGQIGARFAFGSELQTWSVVLKDRPERALYDVAHREYLVAILNLAQGQYRNAFKGLRLVLELHLQGVLLSTDPVGLSEWLRNAKDTIWARIIEDDGVFGKRFARAFFPELEPRVGAVQAVARTLYRELSEATHGNMPNAIRLPEGISFDQEAFDTWCSKADTLRSVVHFSLTLRYLNEIGDARLYLVEPMLLERLGNITTIRERLGGPV